MKIPFNRLWTSLESSRATLFESIDRVLQSGRYILGAEVEAFEKEFCSYLGASSGVGVASGTDALTLALLAGDVGLGSEVLLPAFGPGATITAILATGASPVPVDVNWDFTIDQQQLEKALTPRTKALVVVHLFGRPDQIIALKKFSQKHDLWLVEDCAQAHGAAVWDAETLHWRKAGTIGDAAAFSFYPTKNLGALGDAGFCVARSAAISERLRSLRQYGWKRRDKALQAGRNSRMDEVQAAVLRAGLPHLDSWNERRRALVGAYEKLLADRWEIFATPHGKDNTPLRSASHLHVIRVERRNALRRHLAALSIGSGVHYPLAHTQQKAFRVFAKTTGYPVAEKLARQVLSLPLHPFLNDSEVEQVVSSLINFWSSQ